MVLRQSENQEFADIGGLGMQSRRKAKRLNAENRKASRPGRSDSVETDRDSKIMEIENRRALVNSKSGRERASDFGMVSKCFMEMTFHGGAAPRTTGSRRRHAAIRSYVEKERGEFETETTFSAAARELRIKRRSGEPHFLKKPIRSLFSENTLSFLFFSCKTVKIELLKNLSVWRGLFRFSESHHSEMQRKKRSSTATSVTRSQDIFEKCEFFAGEKAAAIAAGRESDGRAKL